MESDRCVGRDDTRNSPLASQVIEVSLAHEQPSVAGCRRRLVDSTTAVAAGQGGQMRRVSVAEGRSVTVRQGMLRNNITN